MPDRKTPFPMFWPGPVLALLAWVLIAPTWPTGAGPARVSCAVMSFCPPANPQATSLGAAIPIDTLPQVNALPSEGEEQDQVDAPGEARLSFQIPGSFRTVAPLRLIVPRPIPSLYPLRC